MATLNCSWVTIGDANYSTDDNYLYVDWSESPNPGGNSSTISWTAYFHYHNSDARLDNVTVNINGTEVWRNSGNVHAWGQNYTTRNLYLNSGTTTVAHNNDGSKYMGVSASINVDGVWSSGSGAWWLTDFTRVPSTPYFSAGPTRTLRSVSASITGSTFYGSSSQYNMDYYTWNGSAWAGPYGGQSNSTGAFTFPGLSDGVTYRFRGYASDSEGSGGAVTSDIAIPTVPSAPNSISVSAPAGRSVTVTAGNATNGGSAITGYYVQKSLDNGVTWTNSAGVVNGADAMTSQSYPYTGLNGGATYKFRVYAVNEMGQGAYTTTSSGTFIPSLGKRYDLATTSWVSPSTAKRYDLASLQWVSIGTSKKYIAGTGWVDFV